MAARRGKRGKPRAENLAAGLCRDGDVMRQQEVDLILGQAAIRRRVAAAASPSPGIGLASA